MKKVLIVLLCHISFLWSETITVGYSSNSLSDFSKKDVSISADIWLKEIVRGLGMDVKTIIYDDPKIMMQDLKENKLDYVSGFGLTFVENFDLSLLEDGFTKGYLNGEEEVYVILVQKNSGIKSLNDLKDLPIGMLKGDEIMRLYLDLQLANNTNTSLPLETFTTRQRVLLKLFFGKLKAAVVTNKTFELAKELNPQIGKKLKVLHKTDLQATVFGFLRKSLKEETKEKMLQIAKDVHTNTKGKQLLTIYKTERIVDSKLEGLKAFDILYTQTLHSNHKGK